MSFDTDRFIIEVQSRPVLWDQEMRDYSNKHLKIKAWEDVAAAMYSDYSSKESKEKTAIYDNMIRKWKNLRDCYSRELTLLANKKSGSARSNKKPYIYFGNLSFLRQCVEKRKTSSSMDNSLSDENGALVIADGNQEFTNNDKPEEGNENSDTPIVKIDVRPATVSSKKRNRDAILAEEMKILKDMSKRLAQKAENEQKKEKETDPDPDKLFLLSLLPDIKKIPEDARLEMKAELISVVGRWKRFFLPIPGQGAYAQTPDPVMAGSLEHNDRQPTPLMEHNNYSTDTSLAVASGSSLTQDSNFEGSSKMPTYTPL